MDKISVIVPVYNAGKYLERSLTSICGQTYQNLEILLIDDGSTDDSLEQCLAWAKQDERIQVFHQENGGVSAARNKGLDEATGVYIMFVDADDRIETKMVEELYELAKAGQADVVTCEYVEEHEGNDSETSTNECTAQENIHVQEAEDEITAGLQLLLPWAVYCKLYRKDVIGAIRFEAYKIAEDLLFNTEIICSHKLERVVTVKKPMYYYFIHKNSAIRQGYQRKYLEGVQVEARCYDRLMKISPQFGEINIVGCSMSMMFERIAELPRKDRLAVKEDFIRCKKIAKQYKRALLPRGNMHRRISGALKIYTPNLYMWSLILRKRK